MNAKPTKRVQYIVQHFNGLRWRDFATETKLKDARSAFRIHKNVKPGWEFQIVKRETTDTVL